MKGITYTSTSTASSAPAITEEEEWYVKVASRFSRAKRRGGEDGGGAMILLHYLDVCFLCKRHISCNRDIFMYKGDAAFCSEECRQEQMDMDEALETVARRQRLLQKPSPPAPASCMANKAAAEDVEGVRRREAAASRPQMMHRRTTIANLAARTPVVAS